MANFTLNLRGAFAEGATVGAYPASNWPAHVTSPSGAPLGAATNTQTVSGQSVTFTGLTDGTRYYVAQNDAATKYISISVGQDVSQSDPASQAELNAHEADTTSVHGITDTTDIPDANLASPNNPAYKMAIPWRMALHADTQVAATYALPEGFYVSAASAATNSQMGVVYLDPADFAVTGLTTKYRLRATALVNTIAPAITFTFGLYPVTATAGGADAGNATLGTVATGSTVAFASPGVQSLNQGNSGDFTAPAAGFYTLGYVSSRTITANSNVTVAAVLQVRNV